LIFPSMSKTAEFGQKTQGILGVSNIRLPLHGNTKNPGS
jgi:hypothetical protein